jgi:phage portal protein BeeE
VPPHKIGDLERATFSNVEQQDRATAPTRSCRARRAVGSSASREPHPAPSSAARSTPKIQLNGLLRGDYATRTNGYRSAIITGWMSRNEARELEDMNPAEGLDEFLTPLNMTTGVDPTDPPRHQEGPRHEEGRSLFAARSRPGYTHPGGRRR